MGACGCQCGGRTANQAAPASQLGVDVVRGQCVCVGGVHRRAGQYACTGFWGRVGVLDGLTI